MGAEATLKMLLLGEDRSASRALKGVGSEAEHSGSKLRAFAKVGAAALVGLSVAAAEFGKKSVEAYQDAAKESGQLSRVTGMTIKQASRLRFAGEESGVAFTSLAKGMQIFSKQQSIATDATIQFEQKVKDAAKQGKTYTGHLTGSAAAFTQLGIATSDAAGKTIPMQKLLGEVAEQFKTMPDGPNKTALAMQLFGKGGADMIKVLNKGKDGLKELAEEADRTGNSLSNVDSYKKELQAQRAFHASITGLKVQVGQALMPILTSLFTTLATKIGPIFQRVTTFVRQHGDTIRRVAPIVLALASAIGVAGLAMKAFGAVTAVASSPVGLIVLAIIAIGAAFAYAYKHSDTFRAWVDNKLVPALKKAGEWIRQKVLPALKQIGEWIMQHVVPAVATMVKWWAQHVLPIYVKVYGFIFTKLIPAFIKIAAGIIHFVAAAKQKFDEFKAKVGEIVGKVAQVQQGIIQKLGQVISFFASLPGKILHAIGSLGSLLFNAGKAIIQGLINGVESMIGSLTSKLHSITKLIPLHKGPIGKDRMLLHPAGVAIMEGLIKGIDSQKVKLTDALDKLTGYIQSKGKAIADLLSKKSAIVDAVKGFSSSVFGATFQDAEGNQVAGSVDDLLAYQAQQLAQAQQTKADIASLVKAGLSKDLIQQMVSSGASGLANLHTLASGSRGPGGQIALLNSLNAQTAAAYGAAGATAGGVLYNPQIAAAKQDRATAVAIRNELEKWRNDHDKNTVIQIKLEGKTIQASLLELKRKNGNRPLGVS